MTAQIVSLEDIEAARRVAEEPIEPDTFIPIIDVDPETMAIVLRPKTWKKRRQLFDNIVADSIEKAVKLAEVFAEESKGKITQREVLETAHLGIHEAIAKIIECMGEEKPTCKDSAAVFMCSMRPDHYHAGAEYFMDNGRGRAARPLFMDQDVFPDGNPLMAFLRISAVMQPGLAECWRQHQEPDDKEPPKE